MMIILPMILYLLWSSCFPIGKMLLEVGPPLFLTAARMLLAGGVLLGYIAFRKRKEFRMRGRQWLSLALLGVFSIYLTNICEFWGLQHLSAAKTCFIYSLSPFFAALFSYLHFGEKMSKGKWLGFMIGFIGFLPVLFVQSGSEDLFSLNNWLSLPELAVAGAALFSVYGWVILRLTVKDNQVSPMMANGASMLIGGMMALVHSFFVDAWAPLPVAGMHLGTFLKGIIAMTVISNIVCYNLYGYLLKRFTATLLSFIGLLSPIFASLNSWLLLGEPPSLIICSSTLIVLLGLFIVYKSEIKQGYMPSSA
ncbi:MAG: EamA family transporter [Chlamydiia bacterium]|nr:EamA family transporter [Chlamydiia bacterium]